MLLRAADATIAACKGWPADVFTHARIMFEEKTEEIETGRFNMVGWFRGSRAVGWYERAGEEEIGLRQQDRESFY